MASNLGGTVPYRCYTGSVLLELVIENPFSSECFLFSNYHSYRDSGDIAGHAGPSLQNGTEKVPRPKTPGVGVLPSYFFQIGLADSDD